MVYPSVKAAACAFILPNIFNGISFFPGAGSTSEMEVDPEPSSPPFSLSPELEEWIWKDNMMFLQDKNIFEHTYFQ